MNCENSKCENWDCNQYGYGCTIINGACPIRQDLKASSKKYIYESEVIIPDGRKSVKERCKNKELCNGSL